jgi:hypothetical protein
MPGKKTAGHVDSNVVVANAQHFGRFSLSPSVMTISPDEPREGIQLGNINVTVFREGDVC